LRRWSITLLVNSLQSSYVAALGRTSLSLNGAQRSDHLATIRKDVDAGPQDGRFEMTLQKLDRPLVCYFVLFSIILFFLFFLVLLVVIFSPKVAARPSEMSSTVALEASMGAERAFHRTQSAAAADVTTLCTFREREIPLLFHPRTLPLPSQSPI
jgi:hypothetical protein